MRTCAVILNPISGTARGRLGPDRAPDLLRDAGYDAEVLVTTAAGQGTDLAAAAAERHPVVVIAGGDGSVSEAARGVAGTGAALAVLPCGSGNDFAQGLGLRDLDAGLAALRGGRRLAVDTATFAGRFFVNSCGLFLNGEVSLTAANVARRWGHWRYPIATLRELGRRRSVEARWRLDTADGPLELDGPWTLAEIGNGRQCGGGFMLTPNADPADGALDFCLVKAMPLWALLTTLPRTADGGHLSSPWVLDPRARSAEVEVAEPFAVHWDGEADRLEAGAWRFETTPGALEVFVPEVGA